MCDPGWGHTSTLKGVDTTGEGGEEGIMMTIMIVLEYFLVLVSIDEPNTYVGTYVGSGVGGYMTGGYMFGGLYVRKDI